MAETVDITKIKAIQTMPTVKSVDKDWIGWIDFVVDKYGSDLGKQIFINAWEKRGSRDANTRTIRLHLKNKYNIEIDESVWDKIVDVGGGIGDTFGKMFKVGKVTLYVVGGVILLGVGFAIYNNVRGAKVPSLKGGLGK